MEITDLMVGDWVYVSGKPVKITKDDLATMLMFLDNDSKIDPIPLTKEILVKNGFEKNDRGDFVIDDTIVIAKENYCPKNYYACTWYQEDFDDEIYYIGICELTFVHQLQHLLRLAGIEKEIEL